MIYFFGLAISLELRRLAQLRERGESGFVISSHLLLLAVPSSLRLLVALPTASAPRQQPTEVLLKRCTGVGVFVGLGQRREPSLKFLVRVTKVADIREVKAEVRESQWMRSQQIRDGLS